MRKLTACLLLLAAFVCAHAASSEAAQGSATIQRGRVVIVRTGKLARQFPERRRATNSDGRDSVAESLEALTFGVGNIDEFQVSDRGLTFLCDAGFPHVIQASARRPLLLQPRAAIAVRKARRAARRIREMI